MISFSHYVLCLIFHSIPFFFSLFFLLLNFFLLSCLDFLLWFPILYSQLSYFTLHFSSFAFFFLFHSISFFFIVILPYQRFFFPNSFPSFHLSIPYFFFACIHSSFYSVFTFFLFHSISFLFIVTIPIKRLFLFPNSISSFHISVPYFFSIPLFIASSLSFYFILLLFLLLSICLFLILLSISTTFSPYTFSLSSDKNYFGNVQQTLLNSFDPNEIYYSM